MAAAVPVSVTEIPNLDPPPYFAAVGRHEGYELIRLPSGHAAVHLTGHADVQRAFTNPTLSRALANVRGGPSFYPIVLPSTLLLTLDPPQHGKIKKMVSAAFAAGALEALRPAVESTVHALITEMAAGSCCSDLGRSLIQPLASRVLCGLLGVPQEDGALFEEHAVGLQTMGWDGSDPAASVGALVGYLAELVTGTRPSAPGGLVQHVLQARESADRISDELVIGLLLLIVVAGDQSIVSVMTKGMYAALAAPSLWQLAVDRSDLRPGLVEEFLRLLPLGYIPSLPRVATVDVEFSRGVIRAGQAVFPNGLLAGRDPEVFPQPEVIDPGRRARHFGFGYGVHHCLGSALARMEMIQTLDSLARRLPTLRLAVAPEDLRWHDGWLVRRPTALPVTW
jgi:cytochrome P450